MLDELQGWWNSFVEYVGPENQVWIRHGGVAAGALLGGHVLGSIVARFLRARNFDAVLRFSTAGNASATDGAHGFTPTFFAGMLVRLTVWSAAGSWLARQHGWVDFAGTLGVVVSRSWALAGVLFGALALGAFVVRRLSDCFGTVPGAGLAGVGPRNGVAGSVRGVPGAIAAGVYGLVLLLALLTMADLFDWPLTRNSAQSLWQLAHQLLIAGGALLIGGLGARWAREVVTSDGAASPEKKAGQYTALGIVAASTVLAISVLLSSVGLSLGIVALVLLGGALWVMRRRISDIAAGLQLRRHNVSQVEFEGTPWQVSHIGFVESDVCHGGEIHRVQNRVVLEARLNGHSAAAV